MFTIAIIILIAAISIYVSLPVKITNSSLDTDANSNNRESADMLDEASPLNIDTSVLNTKIGEIDPMDHVNSSMFE